MRQLQAETLYDEILLTFALLFTRDDQSKRLAQKLFDQYNAKLLIATRERSEDGQSWNVTRRTVDGTKYTPEGRCVVIPEWSLFFQGQVPMYPHFKHYCGHLALFKKQMSEWKPRTVAEMFQQGYSDRIGWYVSWVTVTFTFLGIITIVTSIMQTYWSYEGAYASVQSLLLQKQQMNLTQT